MSIKIGYWESWENVVWWDSTVPGNCAAGCAQSDTFLQMIQPYDVINWAFVLASENWYSGYDPTGGCSKYNTCGGASCPYCSDDNTWPAPDGDLSLRIAPKCRGPSIATAITFGDTTPSSTAIAIRECVRLAHSVGKKINLSIGGWSDCIKIVDGSKLITLIADLVGFTFVDGVDIDIEHLSMTTADQPPWITTPNCKATNPNLAPFADFINGLRQQLDILKGNWKTYISTAQAWLETVKSAYPVYYTNNVSFLSSLSVPDLQISFTTRFNSFVCDSQTLGFPQSYITDGEGVMLWPMMKNSVGYVNLMIYDINLAPGMSYMDFYQNTIRETLKMVPKEQIVIGFEPGVQAGAPTQPPITPAEITAITQYAQQMGLKGTMFWAINDPVNHPTFIESSGFMSNSNSKNILLLLLVSLIIIGIIYLVRKQK